MRKEQRGALLIDVMVAVAILMIAINAWLGGFDHYFSASRHTADGEGLVRALDLALERARTCSTPQCLRDFRSSCRRPGPEDVESGCTWGRFEIEYDVARGADATFTVTVRSRKTAHTRSRSLSTLVRLR